jgi:DNA polymerase III epsilon subunit family exonuclease
MFYKVLFPERLVQQDTRQFALRRPIQFLLEPTAILRNLPYVVFDFETTGLDHAYDRIIEIGAQKILNGQVLGEMTSLVRVDGDLSRVIQKITGISPEMLADQPTIEECLPSFLSFIEGSVLVAHNASFDLNFLKSEASRQGVDLEWATLCTLKMARMLLPELERKNLDSLAQHYGLTFESRHRSIGDVKVTAQILSLLLENKAKEMIEWQDFVPFQILT